MQNMMQQALGQMQAATPTYGATNQLIGMAGNYFNQGFNQLADTVNRIGEAKKQAAINQIIAGADTTDPYAAQGALFGSLSKIPGVTATEALGLSTAATKNAIDKMKYDNLLEQQMFERGASSIDTGTGQRYKYNTETKQYEPFGKPKPVTGKGYGAITDDFGTTYIYDKDTGKYKPIVNEGAGKGRVSPKNIKTVNVTNRDSYGNETTETYTINTNTGNVVQNGVDTGVKVPGGTKRPTLSDKDKQFIDGYQSTVKDIADMDAIFTDSRSAGSFGPIDAYTAWVGGKMGTDEGNIYTLFNSLRGKMMTSITDQLAGALSDKDMAYLESQLPSSSDTFAQAQIKWNNFKQRYRQILDDRIKRLRESNPQAVSRYSKNTVVTGPDGKQYEIVD